MVKTTKPLTVPPTKHTQTFLNFPLCTDLDTLDADIAIIGIPFGTAYEASDLNTNQCKASDEVRAVANRHCSDLGRYDFDLGGTLFDDRPVKVVDVGNVYADVHDMASNFPRAQAAVERILDAGAMPIVLGGDHSIPIPVLRAFKGRGPITLLQIDAHIDWRDEINGVRDGLSSPMRRASEMDHIGEMFQIGIRGTGSARPEEAKAAKAYGSNIITASEVFEKGMESVIARIPDGGNYYITIDADGLDPSVMPACGAPSPGGLLYHHVRTLLHALVKKGRLVGMDIVELKPMNDVNSISSLTATRMIMNVIGAATRANYFNK